MFRFTVAAVTLAALVTTGAFAQSAGRARQGAPEQPDALSALLAEVHELRLVLQRQGADSARIQLLVSRLTIQETRVSRLARDLTEARDQLARLDSEQREAAEHLKRMESAAAQISDVRERTDIEEQSAMIRRQLVESRGREQQLRAREAELDASYGAEQARWVEISNRLDELERALARP
jgi:chromosome segregation ATPase